MGKKLVSILFRCVGVYIVAGFLILIYLFGKYYLTDIKTLEAAEYIPEVDEIELKEGSNVTLFNTYTLHINAFGSRNLFEVSGEDENIVVLLGDSMFFGYGLNDNETISYFLNKIDTKRRYINLAKPGFNIQDSVEHYFLKCEKIKPPKMVILQILLPTDVTASRYVDEKISQVVVNDYRYVFYPYRIIFSKERLFHYYQKIVYEKIWQDLSDERFIKFVQKPLDRLIKGVSKDNTRIMVICFDVNAQLMRYKARLSQYCLENNLPFFMAEGLIGREYGENRLPDGHPSANLNRTLANQIKKIADKLL